MKYYENINPSEFTKQDCNVMCVKVTLALK